MIHRSAPHAGRPTVDTYNRYFLRYVAGITPLEVIDKMLFMNPRKSKRQEAAKRVKDLLVAADAKQRVFDDQLLLARQSSSSAAGGLSGAMELDLGYGVAPAIAYDAGLITPVPAARGSAMDDGAVGFVPQKQQDMAAPASSSSASTAVAAGAFTPAPARPRLPLQSLATNTLPMAQAGAASAASTVANMSTHSVASASGGSSGGGAGGMSPAPSSSSSSGAAALASSSDSQPANGAVQQQQGSSCPAPSPLTGGKRPRAGRGTKLDMIDSPVALAATPPAAAAFVAPPSSSGAMPAPVTSSASSLTQHAPAPPRPGPQPGAFVVANKKARLAQQQQQVAGMSGGSMDDHIADSDAAALTSLTHHASLGSHSYDGRLFDDDEHGDEAEEEEEIDSDYESDLAVSAEEAAADADAATPAGRALEAAMLAAIEARLPALLLGQAPKQNANQQYHQQQHYQQQGGSTSRLPPYARAQAAAASSYRPSTRVLAVVGGHRLDGRLTVPAAVPTSPTSATATATKSISGSGSTDRHPPLPITIHAYRGLRDLLACAGEASDRGAVRMAAAAMAGIIPGPLLLSPTAGAAGTAAAGSDAAGDGEDVANAISGCTDATASASSSSLSSSAAAASVSSSSAALPISSHLAYSDLTSPQMKPRSSSGRVVPLLVPSSASSAVVPAAQLAFVLPAPLASTATAPAPAAAADSTSAASGLPVQSLVSLQPYRDGVPAVITVTAPAAVAPTTGAAFDAEVPSAASISTPASASSNGDEAAPLPAQAIAAATPKRGADAEAASLTTPPAGHHPQKAAPTEKPLADAASSTQPLVVPIPARNPTTSLSFSRHGYRAHRLAYGHVPVSALLLVLPPAPTSLALGNNAIANPRAMLMSGSNGGSSIGWSLSLPSIELFASAAARSLSAQLLPHIPPYDHRGDPVFSRARATFEPLVHCLRAAAGSLVLDSRGGGVKVLMVAQRPTTSPDAFDLAAGSIHQALAHASSTTTASSSSSSASSRTASPLSLASVRSRLAEEASAMWGTCLTSLLTAKGCAPVSAVGSMFAVQVAALEAVVPMPNARASAAPVAAPGGGRSGKQATAPPAPLARECVMVTLDLTATPSAMLGY